MASEIQQPLPASGPVSSRDRIEAIDTLRGVAVLGILVMNVTSYGLPMASYFTPVPYVADTTGNLLTWLFNHLFFEYKMMAIFSMLFGAGLILMGRRAEDAGRRFAGIYYRRILWLLAIGLVHGYVFWYGDILVTYALCGLLLYPLRRRSPRALIIVGCAFILFGALVRYAGGDSFSQLRNAAERVEQKMAEGIEPTQEEIALSEAWVEMQRSFDSSPEQLQRAVDSHRGDLGTVLRVNAASTFMMHTRAFAFLMFWRVIGLMLLGMAFMKLGIFSAARSSLSYALWIVIALVVGLPLIGWGAYLMNAHDFDFIHRFLIGGHFNYLASVVVAMGFIGGVMLICQTGKLPSLRSRFAAVGRMALTNYLMQTVICVLIFYGYGLGLHGRVGRPGLWGFVLAIWAVQLIISPWWLSRFQFGPAEWLWRSLTYGKRQPFRIST